MAYKNIYTGEVTENPPTDESGQIATGPNGEQVWFDSNEPISIAPASESVGGVDTVGPVMTIAGDVGYPTVSPTEVAQEAQSETIAPSTPAFDMNSLDKQPGESWSDYYQRMNYLTSKDEAEFEKKQRPFILSNLGLLEENGGLRPLTEEEKVYGVVAKRDAQGNPLAYSPGYEPMSEEAKQQLETEKILAKRQALAAKGQLYYDPNDPNAASLKAQGSMELPKYVTGAIEDQRRATETGLSQRLGAKGSRLSTAGGNLRSAMETNFGGIKNAYASGQEQQGLGLLGNTQNYLSGLQNRNANVYGNVSQGGLGLIPQFQMAAQPYTFGQKLSDEREDLNLNRNTALNQGILSGAGLVGGLVKSYLGGR